MAAICLPCSASELPHVWQTNVKTEVSANCVTNFTKMMHAWRGWKSSDHELVRRRMQQYRTTKADEDAATTAAERKAKEVRERSRVIKQQQRFRDVRDENLPKGKALMAIEVIIGECALEFTALYERDRVYLSFLWLVWFLDPAILDPPCDECCNGYRRVSDLTHI